MTSDAPLRPRPRAERWSPSHIHHTQKRPHGATFRHPLSTHRPKRQNVLCGCVPDNGRLSGFHRGPDATRAAHAPRLAYLKRTARWPGARVPDCGRKAELMDGANRPTGRYIRGALREPH